MQQYMEVFMTEKHRSIKYGTHFHNFMQIDTSQNRRTQDNM